MKTERREALAGEALGSVEAAREYLADAANAGNAEGAVPLRVDIDLGEGWERLLAAIADAGVAVDLDLSGCAVRGAVFDPNKRLSTGKNLIVSLTLPASAATVRTGKAPARFGPQDLGKADAAFDYFTKLKAVRGAGITEIGRGAFAMCTALERAEFPKAAAAGDSAFLGCTALKAVEFPLAETVGDMAFAMCTALERVRLPAAAAIGASAFIFCDALAEADLPSAGDIGPSAFSECALTVASFPSAVRIGECAFLGCNSLSTVKLPAAVRIGDSAFAGCVSLTTVILPEAVYIGKSAFQGCASLRAVSLPAVKSIDRVFTRCEALTTVYLPAVTNIGNFAFQMSTALSALGLPAQAPAMGFRVFMEPYEAGEPQAASLTIRLPDAEAVGGYKRAWGVEADTGADADAGIAAGVYGPNHKGITITYEEPEGTGAGK